MSDDAAWAWQVGSRAALLADTALMADATGILDKVAEGQPFPYVTVGETIEVPDNAHGQFGAELSASYHVWSVYAGQAEARRMAGRIRRVLEHQPVPLIGWDLVGCYFEQTVPVGDPNPELRHLQVRFRVLLDRTT